MMIKNCTKFALTVGIGLSLFSGLSPAAFAGKDDTALVITNISAPARLGALALIHHNEGFFIFNKSEIRKIANHLVARDLRGISQSEVIARLSKHINFRVQQGSDGEFSLQEGGGLDGGVPVEETDNTLETVKETVNTLETAMQAGQGVLILLNLVSAFQKISSFATEEQRKDNLNQIELDYITCLRKNPLKKDIDDTFRKPSECEESFNKFKMATDAMKMRKAARLVENEHNAQQVRLDSSAYAQKNPRLDFEECLRQNPLAEDIVGIPSACRPQFNALRAAVDAMKVYEDTTQN